MTPKNNQRTTKEQPKLNNTQPATTQKPKKNLLYSDDDTVSQQTLRTGRHKETTTSAQSCTSL
jgi:hypothetical protein